MLKRIRVFVLIVFAMLCYEKMSAQYYTIQTDVVGVATGNFNVEGSMILSYKWSVHLPIRYNPIKYGSSKQMKNLTVMPGARYWFTDSGGPGWFLGMQGIYSYFNVGGMFGSKYRYYGNAFGGGLSCGYTLPIAMRWNLEFELGVGLLWANYQKYECQNCGPKLGNFSKLVVAPTKSAISLVLLF